MVEGINIGFTDGLDQQIGEVLLAAGNRDQFDKNTAGIEQKELLGLGIKSRITKR